MNLYDITSQMVDLIEDAVDIETGEIDQQVLDQSQIPFDDKLENTLIYVKRKQMQIEAKEAEIKRLQDSKKVDENVVRNLTHGIGLNLHRSGYRKWESVSGIHKCRLTIDKQTGLPKDRLDLVPSRIPVEYCKLIEQKPRKSPDTDKIRQILQHGGQVEGAQLRLSLTVPRPKLNN